MKVRALSKHFFGTGVAARRIRVGEVFEWPDKNLPDWVEPAEEAPKRGRPKKEPQTLSELNATQPGPLSPKVEPD